MRAIRVLPVLLLAFLAMPASGLPLGHAPFADFAWSEALPREPTDFTSLSSDPDGVLVMHEWRFGDGDEGELLATHGARPTHTFAKPGIYQVTLTVTDNTLQASSVTKHVIVPNTPPIAAMDVAPVAFRNVTVGLVDASYDEDGDAIVESTWTIDGAYVLRDRNASATFDTLGVHEVALEVVDAAGERSHALGHVRIVNRAPIVAMGDIQPREPRVGESVTFSASGMDPDGAGPLTYRWSFHDGYQAEGQTIVRTFAQASNMTVMVRAIDNDGGVSAPAVRTFAIRP